MVEVTRLIDPDMRIEINYTEFIFSHLRNSNGGDQIATDAEKYVHPNKATAEPLEASVKEIDWQHC